MKSFFPTFCFSYTEYCERWEIFRSAAQSCYQWSLNRQECLPGERWRNFNGESLEWLLSSQEHNCLPLSVSRSFSPFCSAHCRFLSNNELAITLIDGGLISPLISRRDINHSIISELLTTYWSSVAVVSLSSWSPACGPRSLSSLASSSSACPSFASPAFCSITFTETTWQAAWYVSS